MSKTYEVSVEVIFDSHDEWLDISTRCDKMAEQLSLQGTGAGTTFGDWGTEGGHQIRSMQYETKSIKAVDAFESWVKSQWLEHAECQIGISTYRDGWIWRKTYSIAEWCHIHGHYRCEDLYFRLQHRG